LGLQIADSLLIFIIIIAITTPSFIVISLRFYLSFYFHFYWEISFNGFELYL